MTQRTEGRLVELYRYPLKGFSGERLIHVDVTPGEALPYDRAFAVENGQGRFDPLAPKHLPKVNFIMRMRDEKLAALETAFETETNVLTIIRDGKQVARGDLSTAIGRSTIEQFLAGFLAGTLRGAPRIVFADGHTFSDVPLKCVHIVNLATVREISRVVGQDVHPLRFRANLYVDGVPPWSEFDWIDKRITLGDCALKVIDRTVRCAATDVNPETAERDMALPQALMRHFGHDDFGVYATVRAGGRLAEGQEFHIEEQ
jgi:uncharacterized protein YcbX